MKLKNKFYLMAYFSLFLVFTACGGGDKHKHHNSLADNFIIKDIVTLDHPISIGRSYQVKIER